MNSGPDPVVAVVIMVVACFIVILGWAICAGLVAMFVNKRVTRIEAEHPEELGEAPDSALLIYALCVFFWPAGFLMGAYFLQKAKTARQGRTCVYIGLGYITVIVLLTCAGMTGVALFAPQLMG